MAAIDFTRTDFAGLDRSALDAAIEALRGPLPLWWRDDDATAASPELDRLLALAERFDAPVAIAAIPSALQPSLVERLSAAPRGIEAAVHGWAHANHAPPGEKTSEFGPHRTLETRLGEAREGLERMTEAFGARALAAFVPPWNRIGDDAPEALAAVGYRCLSVSGPPKAAHARSGLALVNVTFDPIDWRGDRSLVDPQTLLDRLAVLIARTSAEGGEDAPPIGLLTHHLVHDRAVHGFLDALLSHLHETVSVRWFKLSEAMDRAAPGCAQSSR